MSDKPKMIIPDSGMLMTPRSRRDILKLMAMGGSVVLLPSMLAACSNDDNGGGTVVTGPGTGAALTIDFAKGDFAVLQFAYALEQLEADFYTKVMAASSAGTTNLTAADKAILQDIKYHEVLHREYFKVALGTTYGFTITTTYPNLNFNDRTAVLATAKALEDTGVKAYNGAAQYIASTDYLLAAGKIVSVEARHASAIADLIAPNTNAFAPQTFDDVARPATIAGIAQGFIVQKLGFANAPTTFVPGPNGVV
ncbi:MAG: ferritin-like domain-containing protein [Gemmatimonadaceae bacterium]